MIKKLLFLFLFLFAIWGAKAQCNCDVTLTGLSQTSLNIILASNVSYAPGDTICIPAGTYAGFRFFDFEGTETAPVTFKNCGGIVEIIEQQYTGIAFKRSKYIRITGTGDEDFDYGIHVKEVVNGGSVGIGIEDLSSDFEIDHIEIESTGFAGIMAKTDPSCSNPDTWRANGYILKNLSIHDNYIHDTGAEGIYIGYTGGYKVESNRSCNGSLIFGHWLENVDIYNNVLENTAWDGIQVNLVRENGKIRNNHIYNSGTESVFAQDFAMSIGGGIYEVYNNYMEQYVPGMGQGMQFISAESGTKVYNNVLVRPDFHGIFMHNRHEFDDSNEGYYVANNTIIEPGDSGIFYNTVITITEDPAKKFNTQETVPTYMVNNLVVNPGTDHASGNTWKGDQESYFDFNKKVERDSTASRIYTNITTRQMDTLGLMDIINDDYSALDQTSDLIDVGSDVSSWGITYDLDNNPRPSGNNVFDIGAYELQFTVAPPPPPESRRIRLAPNPVTDYFKIVDKKRKRKNKRQRKARMTITSLTGITLFDGDYKLGKRFYGVDTYNPGTYVVTIYYPNNKIFYKYLIIQ
ncbi:right-handed parallel beta-helix repeat-containing protein [uncultured Croceitalea sp.]|uniref:right-handed parallel beta-helix repeat-containing protein n=1 Tax=uncultured Croceitalea sp. TaxID=1798908 RepID=UPI003305E0D8